VLPSPFLGEGPGGEGKIASDAVLIPKKGPYMEVKIMLNRGKPGDVFLLVHEDVHQPR